MVKVAVTGAAGQIAYQLIFSLLKGEVFKDEMLSLRLIDIEPMVDKLKGLVMEIEDVASPLLSDVQALGDHALDKGFKDVDFVFLVGASPRTAGMERSDLLAKNGEIFKIQGKALSEYANPNCKVLVVGNPCNTNALIAMHHAKNIPNTQFFAMTMLDEHRARFQVAKYTKKTISDVNVYIYGNHSATQYPDFENSGVDVNDSWYKEVFIPMIQTRGASVIEQRGASSAASAAHAAVRTAYHLVNASDTIFSIASCSNGDYGAPEGLLVSMPHINNGKIEVYKDFMHSNEAKALIQKSFDELSSEYEQVKSMGLLDD